MKKLIFIYIFVIGIVISGCKKSLDQPSIQKTFKSNYASNINSNNKYNLSGRYIDISGKNYINTDLVFSGANIYTDKDKILLGCSTNDQINCGIVGLFGSLDLNELLKFSDKYSLDLDINKKYLAKTINDTITSKDYNFANIKVDDINRKGKYKFQNNKTMLYIQELKIRNIYFSGKIGSGIIDISISKGSQNIYIKNSLTSGSLYSSGLFDLVVNRLYHSSP